MDGIIAIYIDSLLHLFLMSTVLSKIPMQMVLLRKWMIFIFWPLSVKMAAVLSGAKDLMNVKDLYAQICTQQWMLNLISVVL